MTLLAVSLGVNCRGDATTGEYQVKAAFIYNFTQFVQWPADAFGPTDNRFVIGVLGESPVSAILAQGLRGKNVGDRPIVLEQYASVEQTRRCQLLFISRDSGDGQAAVRALANLPALVVGESDRFMADGGAIRLFIDDGKMRFEVNPGVLSASRLKASAKLMKLAKIYK